MVKTLSPNSKFAQIEQVMKARENLKEDEDCIVVSG